MTTKSMVESASISLIKLALIYINEELNSFKYGFVYIYSTNTKFLFVSAYSTYTK